MRFPHSRFQLSFVDTDSVVKLDYGDGVNSPLIKPQMTENGNAYGKLPGSAITFPPHLRMRHS